MVAFGRTAEIVGEYVRKGNQLYVEGRLQTRAYLDRDDSKRYVTEVIAQRRVQLLGGPEDNRVPKGGDVPEVPAEPPAPEGAVEDEIPF